MTAKRIPIGSSVRRRARRVLKPRLLFFVFTCCTHSTDLRDSVAALTAFIVVYTSKSFIFI